MLRPLLYTLFTQDCLDLIVKYADDTTVLGVITNYNETDNRNGMVWYGVNARCDIIKGFFPKKSIEQ